MNNEQKDLMIKFYFLYFWEMTFLASRVIEVFNTMHIWRLGLLKVRSEVNVSWNESQNTNWQLNKLRRHFAVLKWICALYVYCIWCSKCWKRNFGIYKMKHILRMSPFLSEYLWTLSLTPKPLKNMFSMWVSKFYIFGVLKSIKNCNIKNWPWLNTKTF